MLKRVTLLASLAVVLAAVTASPAFAEGTAWSNTGALRLNGTLTLKRDGASTVTCTISEAVLVAENYGGTAAFSSSWPLPSTKCSNGETWQFASFGEVTEGLRFDSFGGGWSAQLSPWKENWVGGSQTEPFVNGSGSTMSHIDFSETWIGITSSGKKVTASGSLEIYRPGKLLVTVKVI